ncbi:unnamed protein product, partial [marine sediment metagenome]
GVEKKKEGLTSVSLQKSLGIITIDGGFSLMNSTKLCKTLKFFIKSIK